jgi:CRISPR-associated endonuclease Csn1
MSAASGTAPYTLGLDLGPTSIGWALVDEGAGRIIATGVRVFPEGVDRDQQGGEVPKNQQRRIARGMRRQIARRARRKQLLRRALVKAGLLPEVALRPADDPHRVAWEREQFQQEDPYSLRRRALTERLEPFEIGRVLLHLAQRRGFLSNRKADRARKKENSELLKEISDLAAKLGDRTLGQHLADLQAHDPRAQLRGHHTHREMYEREFDAIWAAQQRHYPELLADQLKYGSVGQQTYPHKSIPLGSADPLEKYGLGGILFYQRPIKPPPKSVVGRCELEPKQRRCPRADRLAQRCRLLQEVNNLRLLDTSSAEERLLRTEERALLLRFLERAKEKSFDDVRREFCRKLRVPETIRFNLERGERKKLLGMPTDVALVHKGLFGKAWYDRPEAERNAIVHSLLEDDETFIRHKATGEWGLDEEATERLLALDLEGKESKGYASLSRAAIEKLLPHLERGLPLMTRDGTPSALDAAGYLRPDQRVVNQKNFLPPPPPITNPLVRQALYEVRKLVNAIIRTYGCPARIHVELAREVKGTAIDRARRSREMRDRESARDNAAERIRALGIKVTRDAIDRYLLWEEQRHECVYSGQPISLAQLFGGEVDIDHILPRERSLDNSLMNRVVCFRSENVIKGDQTPYEWLAVTKPAMYDAVLQRTRHKDFPYPKAQRFRQQHVTLDDFIARQLKDTAYITSQVQTYLRWCLGADVLCPKGMHTYELRHHWGLDTILRELPDSPAWREEADLPTGKKDRSDHRHHALDAIVIALTDRSRLQKLAALFRDQRAGHTGEVLPEPWPEFRADVERAVNAINVSHRAHRKVSGRLHEETIYGPTDKPGRKREGERPWAKGWIERPGVFVCRKPLEGLTLAEVEHIRDERVRELVTERLAQHGLKPGRKEKKQKEVAEKSGAGEATSSRAIPKEVWKEPLRLTPREGQPSAHSAVIKTVRVLKIEGTIRPIRKGLAWVKPGSLHHLCIFEYVDTRGRPRREAVFVSMLEAAERLKRKEPLICRTHPTRPDARFVLSLSRSEMVLGTFKGKERLARFVTAASTQGQLYFAPHTDARPSKEMTKFAVKAATLVGRKVTVDVLGRLRWAND